MLVSIIIPCYNAGQYIAECLEHALTQTHRPIEIIAVDNNSSDNTLSILQDWQREHPSLLRVLEVRKQGAPAARNAGLAVAAGEWLQFLDADDLILPEKIERQVDLLSRARPQPVQIIGSYVDAHPDGKSIPRPARAAAPFDVIAFSNLGQTSANLFCRESVLAIGCWDESLPNAQDLDLIFRLLMMKEGEGVLYDPHFNTIYRHHNAGSITSRHPSLLTRNTLKVRLSHFSNLKQQHSQLFAREQALFEDMLYFAIYRAGIYDIALAVDCRNQYLGKDYKPSFRPGVFSMAHLMGLHLLGFRQMMSLRWQLKQCLDVVRSGTFMQTLKSGTHCLSRGYRSCIKI